MFLVLLLYSFVVQNGILFQNCTFLTEFSVYRSCLVQISQQCPELFIYKTWNDIFTKFPVWINCTMWGIFAINLKWKNRIAYITINYCITSTWPWNMLILNINKSYQLLKSVVYIFCGTHFLIFFFILKLWLLTMNVMTVGFFSVLLFLPYRYVIP